jgi:hypothetical protein
MERDISDFYEEHGIELSTSNQRSHLLSYLAGVTIGQQPLVTANGQIMSLLLSMKSDFVFGLKSMPQA